MSNGNPTGLRMSIPDAAGDGAPLVPKVDDFDLAMVISETRPGDVRRALSKGLLCKGRLS